MIGQFNSILRLWTINLKFTVEETRSCSLNRARVTYCRATLSVFAYISGNNGAAVAKRRLDGFKAGTHGLCKQTETNWNVLKETLCGSVVQSHKQRNGVYYSQCASGEQIDIEISSNGFHLMPTWHAGG